MASDIMQKRAIYINRNNELIQEFHFAHASTLIKINNSFNTSFYGSVMWDLFGTEATWLEKSWNVSLSKIQYNVHRYLLEPLTNTRNIMTSLYSRYINFVDQHYSSNDISGTKPCQRCQERLSTNNRFESSKNHVDDQQKLR